MTTDVFKVSAYNRFLRYLSCQDTAAAPILGPDGIIIPKYSTWSDVVDNRNIDKAGFVTQIITFLENSERLNDLDNLNKANGKLSHMQKYKLDELKLKLEDLHNSQYGSIKTYQNNDFNDNKVEFLKSISIYILLLFSIIFILLSLSVSQVISQVKFLTISLLCGFVMIIYLITSIRQNMYRRNDDWNKFYFNPPNVKTRM